jgi:L-iditol 2-dehydrogenase
MLGDQRVEVIDLPEPEPHDDFVVVKVLASAICGSERHAYDGEEQRETNGGHEGAGIVVKAAGAKRVREGDRVTIYSGRHCGHCQQCLVGNWILCEDTTPPPANRVYIGNHSQYVLKREDMLMPLPEDISFEVGSILQDAVGTPYRLITKLAVTARDTVLVTGQGPLGIAALLLCKHLNARVFVSDVSETRLAVARECGADEALNPASDDLQARILELTGGRGVDVAIDCAGHPTARVAGLDAVRRGGRVGWIGLGQTETTINAGQQLILKELQLIGSWYSMPADHAVMIDLVRRGLRVDRMITHRFDIEEAQRAFETFCSTSGTKVIINPWNSSH